MENNTNDKKFEKENLKYILKDLFDLKIENFRIKNLGKYIYFIKKYFTFLEKLTEKFECPICFENMKIIGKLNNCNHQFCYDCIEKWKKKSKKCPLCRKKFSKIIRINY